MRTAASGPPYAENGILDFPVTPTCPYDWPPPPPPHVCVQINSQAFLFSRVFSSLRPSSLPFSDRHASRLLQGISESFRERARLWPRTLAPPDTSPRSLALDRLAPSSQPSRTPSRRCRERGRALELRPDVRVFSAKISTAAVTCGRERGSGEVSNSTRAQIAQLEILFNGFRKPIV